VTEQRLSTEVRPRQNAYFQICHTDFHAVHAARELGQESRLGSSARLPPC